VSEKCRETETVPRNFTLKRVMMAVFEAVNGARRKRWTQRGRGCSVVRIRDGQNGNPVSGFFAYNPAFPGGVHVAR
jgi:hypothetical protein